MEEYNDQDLQFRDKNSEAYRLFDDHYERHILKRQPREQNDYGDEDEDENENEEKGNYGSNVEQDVLNADEK